VPNKIELEYNKLTSKHSPYEGQQAHPHFILIAASQDPLLPMIPSIPVEYVREE
jgi:hypothetical protein